MSFVRICFPHFIAFYFGQTVYKTLAINGTMRAVFSLDVRLPRACTQDANYCEGAEKESKAKNYEELLA